VQKVGIKELASILDNSASYATAAPILSTNLPPQTLLTIPKYSTASTFPAPRMRSTQSAAAGSLSSQQATFTFSGPIVVHLLYCAGAVILAGATGRVNWNSAPFLPSDSAESFPP
jgi:hypothetical protein